MANPERHLHAADRRAGMRRATRWLILIIGTLSIAADSHRHGIIDSVTTALHRVCTELAQHARLTRLDSYHHHVAMSDHP